MNKITRMLLPVISLLTFGEIKGQDNGKVFVTTGAGIIKSPGSLHKVFKPSIAFNSGLELVNKKNWFLQGSLDFYTLKYNQQFKEDESPYLSVNTPSHPFP